MTRIASLELMIAKTNAYIARLQQRVVKLTQELEAKKLKLIEEAKEPVTASVPEVNPAA